MRSPVLAAIGLVFGGVLVAMIAYLAFVGTNDLALLDTKMICTLTNHPEVKVTGTDLGYPVEHGGRLYFYFGDTRDYDPNLNIKDATQKIQIENERTHLEGADSVATAPLSFNPDNCIPPLQFIELENSFASVTMDGQSLGNFQAPVSAFSHGGKMWAFFTLRDAYGHALGDDVVPGGVSVVASSTDGYSFEKQWEISTSKFLWPVSQVISRDEVQDTPSEYQLFPGLLLVWGTGREIPEAKFRHSYPYLAIAPLLDSGLGRGWLYFGGVDGSGKPRWESSEYSAASLFEPSDPHHCLAEFSVVRTPYGEWMMLYACALPPNGPRGIFLRRAEAPWGPWSSPLLIFDPANGYCQFMFARDPNVCANKGPNPYEESQRDDKDPSLIAWGGEYAPELLPARYFKVDGEIMTIYYVMSTWNPYQAVLIRARVTTGRFARFLASFCNFYSLALRAFGLSQTTAGINYGKFGVNR